MQSVHRLWQVNLNVCDILACKCLDMWATNLMCPWLVSAASTTWEQNLRLSLVQSGAIRELLFGSIPWDIISKSNTLCWPLVNDRQCFYIILNLCAIWIARQFETRTNCSDEFWSTNTRTTHCEGYATTGQRTFCAIRLLISIGSVLI